jgi:hypothetical protein
MVDVIVIDDTRLIRKVQPLQIFKVMVLVGAKLIGKTIHGNGDYSGE